MFLNKPSQAQLENRFKHHAPNVRQAEQYAILRTAVLNLSQQIVSAAPASEELNRALDHLDHVMMLAIAAIARNHGSLDTDQCCAQELPPRSHSTGGGQMAPNADIQNLRALLDDACTGNPGLERRRADIRARTGV